MKHIKTLNIITSEVRIVPADKYLIKEIRAAISYCKRKPDIEILGGSRFAIQKVLETLEKRIDKINNKDTLFTDFYEALLCNIEVLDAIYNNTENTDVKCVLLGQKIGYEVVTNTIRRINKHKDVSESK